MQHCMCSSEVSQQMCLTFEVGKKLESNVLFFKLNNSLVWFGGFFFKFFFLKENVWNEQVVIRRMESNDSTFSLWAFLLYQVLSST